MSFDASAALCQSTTGSTRGGQVGEKSNRVACSHSRKVDPGNVQVLAVRLGKALRTSAERVLKNPCSPRGTRTASGHRDLVQVDIIQ